MEKKEFTEQVGKLIVDNPAKFIKIRDILDEMFGGRSIGSVDAISDREYERLRDRFRDVDVPFSWCSSKESVYQLYKVIDSQRGRNRRYDDSPTVKKSSKSKKKGLFGIFR